MPAVFEYRVPGSDDSSLLVAAVGQLQPSVTQGTVDTKRAQNVLRPLHEQRAQIGIAFLADIHLRLALTGVSSTGCSSR